jgi:hypothetical protein
MRESPPNQPSNIATKARWRSIRFSTRTLFIVMTALALWLGYEIDWIRQRHDFIGRQEQIVIRFNDATIDLNYDFPRAEILSRSSPTAGILWLFSEADVSAMDVLVVVDDDAVDLKCPIEAYDEVKRAHSLFPEALIVAAILPRSDFLRRPPPAQTSVSSADGVEVEQ